MWGHAKIVEIFPDKKCGIVENSSVKIMFQFSDFRRINVNHQTREWRFKGAEPCPRLSIGDEIYFDNIANSSTRITAWTTKPVHLAAFGGNENQFQKKPALQPKGERAPTKPPPAYSTFQPDDHTMASHARNNYANKERERPQK